MNEAIRRGLPPGGRRTSGRYRVRPHKTTLRPDIDAHGFNRLVDELEDDAVVEKLRAGK